MIRLVLLLSIGLCAGCGSAAPPSPTSPPSGGPGWKEVSKQEKKTAPATRRRLALVDVSLVDGDTGNRRRETDANSKESSRTAKMASSGDDASDEPVAASGPSLGKIGGDSGPPGKGGGGLLVSNQVVLDLLRKSIASHLGAIAGCFEEQPEVEKLEIRGALTDLGTIEDVAVRSTTEAAAASLCARLELRKLRIRDYRYGKRRVVLMLQFQSAD